MIYALMLSSANDAAVALAERAGGSIEGFERIFAATAARIGMADHPLLNDPAGLDGPDGVEGGNLVSARDLAIAGAGPARPSHPGGHRGHDHLPLQRAGRRPSPPDQPQLARS